MPLLYDADCGFCRFSVALVLTWDRSRRLRPVAIQSEEGQRLLAALPPPDRLASAHVVEADGSVRSGGSVAGPVLRRMPGGGPLARLANRTPRMTERGYRLVADHRSVLGRLIPRRGRRWAERQIADRST
jgi:predicted DCC family thiol-disulfide oxidoreductase YuxK